MREVTRKSERAFMVQKYREWLNSENTELWQVYGRFSHEKAKELEKCKQLAYSLDGERFRIVHHNCHKFTVGFEFPNPETGAMCFAYITRDADRFIELTWKEGELV